MEHSLRQSSPPVLLYKESNLMHIPPQKIPGYPIPFHL